MQIETTKTITETTEITFPVFLRCGTEVGCHKWETIYRFDANGWRRYVYRSTDISHSRYEIGASMMDMHSMLGDWFAIPYMEPATEADFERLLAEAMEHFNRYRR